MAGKIAVVAGGTGLVGSRLLELLDSAPEYARVVALVRRPTQRPGAKVECREVDFASPASLPAGIAGGDATPVDVFCCLGTTIGVAGSESAFRKVDLDYVVALATWSRTIGARRFLVVSALGADASSRVFYNRVKGEMEQAVRRDGPPSVVVLRPSLLDGSRTQRRLGERLALLLTRPVRALLPKAIRPVRDVDVAAALLLAARLADPPRRFDSSAMHGAAARV